MEDGVDGPEGPVLVEDDAVREKVRLVEHHARLVEVIEGLLPGDDSSDFVAESTKVIESQRLMLALAPPLIQPAAYLGTSMANLERPVLLDQIANGVAQVRFESLASLLGPGAVSA